MEGTTRQANPTAHVVTVLCVFLLNIHDAFSETGTCPFAAKEAR
jgi:hypothetical protein